jgi:hypothetical protein
MQERFSMPRKQRWAVVVVATVLTWTVAMATLGQAAAVATLVPSLGLLVQQIIQAVAGTGAEGTAREPAAGRDSARGAEGEER